MYVRFLNMSNFTLAPFYMKHCQFKLKINYDFILVTIFIEYMYYIDMYYIDIYNEI